VMPIEMATRHLLPPIPTGRNPGPCALDPSGDLLLVADEDSGDLAVIRVRTQSLITMIPVGTRPSSIAVKLF
jgi:YVTN family beta-propeller protein